jgi:hypothetical protein
MEIATCHGTLLIGVLIGLVASSGCAGPRLIVRSERGEVTRNGSSKQFIPVEYDREDVHAAIEPYAELLAVIIRQHDGQLRLRLASAVASGVDAADREFLEEYLSWCEVTRGQRGDCLDARDSNMPGLTVDGKRGIALRMAFSKAMREAAEVVRGIDPAKVEALLLAWFAFYLVTLVAPEPVTKVLDVLMTANLIAFLGWDGFHNVVEGYIDLRKDAADAKDFAALHEAGLKYGRRLSGSMVRIVTALITWGLAREAGVRSSPTELPGGDVAAFNAESQGFELAAVTGGSVTVSTAGIVTLTVASVATVPERAGGDPSTEATQHEPVPDGPEGVVIEEGKIGYLFGRAGGRAHNVERATENAAQMRRIGVPDNAEGRALLRKHFDQTARTSSNVTNTFSNEHGTFEVRESLLSGPGGHVKLNSTWQVMGGGVRRLTTAIPYGG